MCLPSARDAIERVACSLPLCNWSGTGATETPSIVKVTLPDGVPVDPLGETTAVKITGWPTVEGLSDEASVVVVVCKTGALTVCVGSHPLLALTLLSPL